MRWTKMMSFIFEWVKNSVEKGENAPFPTIFFHKVFFLNLGRQKLGLCGKELRYKSLKSVENTVGKGEIARYEHFFFSFFP